MPVCKCIILCLSNFIKLIVCLKRYNVFAVCGVVKCLKIVNARNFTPIHANVVSSYGHMFAFLDRYINIYYFDKLSVMLEYCDYPYLWNICRTTMCTH